MKHLFINYSIKKMSTIKNKLYINRIINCPYSYIIRVLQYTSLFIEEGAGPFTN
jgi:hypothetical protein